MKECHIYLTPTYVIWGSHTLSWNTKNTLWENIEDTARVQKTISVFKTI